MKKEILDKEKTLKIEKLNGTKDDIDTRGFFLCGGDDVCAWIDGLCNPKYH